MSKKIVKEKIKQEKKLDKIARSDAMAYEQIYAEDHGYIDTGNAKKTHELTQAYIKKNTSQKVKEMCFSLDMSNGPIHTKYSRDGRFLIVRNNDGYFSSIDTLKMKPFFEENINDVVYDATYLHNEDFIALAQKRNVFIYNKQGVEVHAVGGNNNVKKMEYLPYNFLLVTASSDGFIKYQDTTDGRFVGKIYVKDKNISSIKQNRTTGVIYTAHENGTVALWSPNSSSYLSKVFCHKTAVNNLEIDYSGTYMYTTGVDQKIKVWDIRQTYEPVNSVKTHFTYTQTALSQRSILAACSGDKIRMFKDLTTANKRDVLYLKHRVVGNDITSLCYKSYEDILTIGHSSGVENIIVPGSGEPTYDTAEESPFLTVKQKQEKEIKMLLNKLPPAFISQDGLHIEDRKAPDTIEHKKRYDNDGDRLRNLLSKYLKKEVDN